MVRCEQRFFVVLAASVLVVGAFGAEARAGSPSVAHYGLKMPGGQADVEQGSGLHFGRLGKWTGLWLVCDRNSGDCANQVLFISGDRLAGAQAGKPIVASESIVLVPPADGWEKFAERHSTVPADVLAELKQQLESRTTRSGPLLDLEGVTIGTVEAGEANLRLYVIAEQPNSLVLELELVEKSGPQAVLTRCFAYAEAEDAQGNDRNDGLEGISWSGRPGEFFIVEEGTRSHSQVNNMLFFQRPRLMRCKLADGRVVVDEAWSKRATEALYAHQTGRTHTLNAISRMGERTVAAVDRNGGWIFRVDAQSGQVQPWLNIYDPELLNLRKRLDEFPGQRQMPYVSIEGIARDDKGDVWMADDPAMPEGFRASCLVRLRNPPSPGP